MNRLTRAVVAALFLGAGAAPVAAQAQEQRIMLTFTPAFATVGGDTEPALSGSLGYRFTEHLSFEGDFTWIDAASGGFGERFGFDSGNITAGVVSDILQRGIGGRSGSDARLNGFNLATFLPTPIRAVSTSAIRASAGGQTMIGTLGLRYEPTVQTARFRPYVSGGLGLNHTEQDFDLAVSTTTTRLADDSLSHSGFAFSAGGGANIRLFSSLWANADAKYFRLSSERNVMRLGGGVGFRF